MAGTDMMSWVVLGVVVIGGILVWKNWPQIAAGLMSGGGGAGGVDCVANPSDPACGGGGGIGGAGGGLGMGVDCSMTPNDPTCQLSSSADYLGPGANSNSTIQKDLIGQYNTICINGGYGCPALDTSKLKKVYNQRRFQTAFAGAGAHRRGSDPYNYYINAMATVLACNTCSACCAGAYGGGMTTGGTGGGCKQPSQLTDADYSGSCVNVCDSRCSSGYMNCFLGHDNNLKRHAYCQCNQNSCVTLKNLWNMSLGIPASGGSGMTGSMVAGPNCNYYYSSKNYCYGPLTAGGCYACAQGSCSAAQSVYNTKCVGGGASGGLTFGTGGSHSGGGNPSGHTFTCAASTGACSTSGQQTCFHICDGIKKKNCVRCIQSSSPATACAQLKAQATRSC